MANRKTYIMIAAALLIIFFLNRRPASAKRAPGDGWTVYGTMNCGWTRKQLDHMKSKQIPHTFVDCDKEDCGDMKAFPTLDDPTGKRTVGFSSI